MVKEISELRMINHWRSYGAAALVRRNLNKWIIEFGNLQHPGLFSTKRKAMEAADNWVIAISRRQ